MIHLLDFNLSTSRHTNSSLLYTYSYIAAIPIFTIGVIANSTLLYLIASDGYFHKMTYRLIRISVISDLISLISSTIIFACMASITRYDINSWLCKVLLTITYSCYGISMTTLCMISVDRYMVIVKPISSRNHHRRNRLIIYIGQVIGTVISVSISLPTLSYSNVHINEVQLCDVPKMTSSITAYIACYIFILYVTPIVIIVINYAKIIRYQFNYIRPGYQDCQEYCNDQLKKKKFIRILIIITSIYLLTTWPFFCVMAGLAITGKSFLQIRAIGIGYYLIAYCSFISTFAISVINPFIYFQFDYNIKKRLIASCKCFNMGQSSIAPNLES